MANILIVAPLVTYPYHGSRRFLWGFEVFGATVGAHARSAVGMAELPFNLPVEIEAEVELHPAQA